MEIKLWELHPQACKVERAEKTCHNTANKTATQWCAPYSNANQAGFWMYSPLDMDFVFDGDKFHILSMQEYSDEDFNLVKSLVRPSDNSSYEKWTLPGFGRTKTTFGSIEPNVIQIWTGLIFQTPPGWCLQIRSPVNFAPVGFHVVEAILETDWLQYDIWMNISVTEVSKKISIRKNTPIAHLIPMRREGFKGEWKISREKMNRDSEEADKVFSYWLSYNKQKFEMGGKQALSETLTKDSTTYFREKNRLIGNEMEPEKSGCPYAHLHSSKEKPEFKSVENSIMLDRFFKKL